MSQESLAMGGWAGFILTAKTMPGERTNFCMEVPPTPASPGAVVMKTDTRKHWYFMEILPLFIIAGSIFVKYG